VDTRDVKQEVVRVTLPLRRTVELLREEPVVGQFFRSQSTEAILTHDLRPRW
jgi:hypothetical protein